MHKAYDTSNRLKVFDMLDRIKIYLPTSIQVKQLDPHTYLAFYKEPHISNGELKYSAIAIKLDDNTDESSIKQAVASAYTKLSQYNQRFT